MRPTSTPPCGAGLNAIRASTSTSPRPPGSTWSSACSPISPVVVCVGDAFAVSPNSNQRSDATLTTATPLPNRSFGPKGPTPSFENTNGLNGTLFRGRDTRAEQQKQMMYSHKGVWLELEPLSIQHISRERRSIWTSFKLVNCI